jgi:uncharacterized protein (UPF0276 family)
MTQLSVNYSEGLLELIQDGLAPIQAIEFGPWLQPERIASLRHELPSLTFHFHHSNLIGRLQWDPKAIHRLHAYLSCTDCPWISAHIALLPSIITLLALELKLYLPLPSPDAAALRFIDRAIWLQRHVALPLILENMPTFPTQRYAHEVDPCRIRQILDETGAGFLLDLAHARIAAGVFHWDVHEYLERLPLERTVEIHVSGLRQRKGVLYDAHEPMEEEDYRLLEWALERTRPEVVTLEYFRDKGKLEEQLGRLAALSWQKT